MQPPLIPDNESQRLAALRDLNLLDTPSEERFDRITRLAERFFRVPVALVSLVDSERQWFKSRQGLDACETSREISFCGHAILSAEIFYIPNTLEDPRFVDNPLVTGEPHIRFYAGAPLQSPDGYTIGTLCIIGIEPKQLTQDELARLRDLADMVESEIARTSLLASAVELSRSNAVLDTVNHLQSQIIAGQSPARIFDYVLQAILKLTNSQTGFIGELLYKSEGTPFLKVEAITNIAANDETQNLFKIHAADELELKRMDTLFSSAITHQKVIIANDMNAAAVRTGLTDVFEEQSVMHCFMGIPLFQNDTLLGMIGIANRVEGYDQSQVSLMAPLLTACQNIIGSLGLEKRRLQAESNLLSSENRIRTIIDTVVDGIVSIDAKGRINTFNPAAERIFGYQAEQVIGHNVKMLMPDPYRSEHDGYLENFLTTGERKIIGIGREVSGKHADGSIFPMELAVSEMHINGERMFTGVVRNIAQRKQLEGELKRYQAIVQSSEDAIISKTVDGIVTSWNPGAEQMFGYSADEMIGRPMLILFPDDRIQEEVDILHKISRGEEVEHFETVRRHKNGSLIDISVTISTLYNNNGEIIGASKIARDITDRKKVDLLKRQFVSTVSHELRTPLTSIRGALGLVLGKSADQLSDKVRKLLEMANRNSERLTLLINDILDLEKIESGSLKFEFKTLDMASLAEKAIQDMEGFAQKHQVQLVLQQAATECLVKGDEHRLQQVYANLISNAVKFSPEHGQVEISLKQLDDVCRIAVRDQGRGIPEEFHSQIFQRFAQVDSSDTREKGGSGLGLSISKAIIESHGGSIGFASEEGKGALFYFDLPIVKVAVQNIPAALSARRVLIVEDNLDVSNILLEMLEEEGMAGDVALSATAAEALLNRQTYHLMLLDLSLPDMNGLQFLEKIRNNSSTAELPVIVVSGRAREGRESFNGNAVTVVDWLQKPIDRTRLERALREALNRSDRPRILHIEDDPDIIQVTQVLLEDFADFNHVASVHDAKQKLAQNDYDLVVLDLTLADGSGVQLLDDLKSRCPVVIFSADIPGTEITRQVEAALTKSVTSNNQLLTTIKNLLQG